MKYLFFIISGIILPFILIGQNNSHHHMSDDSSMEMSNKKNVTDTTIHVMHTMNMDSSMMNIPSAFSRNLPMNVNGSGTSWHPLNSPMYMNMFHKRGWNFMLHYGIFLSYTNQNVNRHSGQRGISDFYSSNWVMLMANKPIGKHGLFMIRGMFSADPLTVGGKGYPLLFETGESWNGKALIDHQHPHDLISELAVGYSYAISKKTDVYTYFGMPGEPAIGPPAFMHRPASLNISNSPVAHHWQDATHITFGVATVGIRYKNCKVEGSTFTGREPDENRYNFDKPRFDSYSARVSVNPIKSLALQVSYASIKSPEALFATENVERFTASALHNLWISNENVLSTSFVWGMNKYLDEDEISSGQSLLLESNLQTKHYSYFTRVEFVQKDNHELFIVSNDEHKNNSIGVFALGLSRYISKNKFFWLDAGASGTAYVFNNALNPYYGNNPYSIQFFLRIIPPRMLHKL